MILQNLFKIALKSNRTKIKVCVPFVPGVRNVVSNTGRIHFAVGRLQFVDNTTNTADIVVDIVGNIDSSMMNHSIVLTGCKKYIKILCCKVLSTNKPLSTRLK